ncbi:MAG: PilZ domain-containing protein [Desulfobacterales bacterium]|nr:PilZ domain-containing protein [Desulfobacterales bacterium]
MKSIKRQRQRIDFVTKVTLNFPTNGEMLNALMKNISMKGIFVETDKKIPIDTPCIAEIIITAPNSKLIMQIEGFVSRHDSEGLGIQFKNDMEWFAFFSIYEHYGRIRKKNDEIN